MMPIPPSVRLYVATIAVHAYGLKESAPTHTYARTSIFTDIVLAKAWAADTVQLAKEAYISAIVTSNVEAYGTMEDIQNHEDELRWDMALGVEGGEA